MSFFYSNVDFILFISDHMIYSYNIFSIRIQLLHRNINLLRKYLFLLMFILISFFSIQFKREFDVRIEILLPILTDRKILFSYVYFFF